MAIIPAHEAQQQGIRLAAALMATAARTAPKTRGLDSIEMAVLDGEDLETLARAMEAKVAEKGGKIPSFTRDAKNVRASSAVLLIGVDAGNFWSIMQGRVDVWRDVGNGIVKSAVFGIICTFVALYQGYETQATPEGVAHATTRTVVVSSLAVLGMDFILTAFMFSTP